MTHTISLTINGEILKRFDSVVPYGQRSTMVSKLMENYSATQNRDLEAINIELLDIEIKELQEKKVKSDAELESKLQLKNKIYEKRSENRKKQLEIQENLIKTAKNCIECGLFSGNDAKKMPKGLVCQQCFHDRKQGYLQSWS